MTPVGAKVREIGKLKVDTLRPCFVVSVAYAQIVSMASFSPTRPIATYGLVLDIEVSFVECPDPVVPGVVWERYSTTVWVDCFTPLGRLPYAL
ncbi:hypothetical protein NL676_039855 [Syzygium grande]|nr:hypothetical protein NL676_039855 [Syzygium grande]